MAMSKTTVRLPEALMTRLRERSRQEGRSLNETAVLAIERGLGGIGADEGWLVLGTVLEAPPTLRYDAEELRRLRDRLGPRTRGLPEDLEWTRGEQR